MTGFFAIARREFRQHRVVLVAAAVASLGALAAPLFADGPHGAMARALTAFVGAIIFAAGIAIGLGATTLAPGMATRRIGFDFARPLSASAIWNGRLAGAMLLGAGTVLILWVPASIAGARPPWNDLWAAPDPPTAWPLWALVGFAVLFAIAHCASLALRSRSGLLALDAGLAALGAYLVWTAFSRLPIYRAEAPSRRLGVGLALAAGAAFLAAGYASVVRGRTDARAGHRALSGILWTLIGAAVLCANGYAAWVHGAKPSDLRENGFWVTAAANGPWVTVSGPARGAEATFVYDTAAGRSERAFTPDWRGPVLSRDGKRAAWIEAGRQGPYPLWTWRLDAPSEKPVRTRILLESYPYLFVLSEDGARLAVWEGGTLTVYDLSQQRVLASARATSGDRQSLSGTFSSPDVFRIHRADDRGIDLLQLDVRARSLAMLGRIETADGLRSFVADARGDRILTLGSRSSDVRLFTASGAPIAALADTPAESRWPEFLPDGRIVLSERSSGSWRLRVFGSDGREGTTVKLPPASSVSVGGEVASGVLCLGVTDAAVRPSAWLVDLNTGAVRKVADDLRPAGSPRAIESVGSDATKLFYGPRNEWLVRFDPFTGERKVLLGKGP